mmetsp:Transcript_22233/g.51819  ORF Transcript_22233/g.51819 Transcript_22233/m.51819 type:complete len:373 (+) Transcript_22233:3-1121(+)
MMPTGMTFLEEVVLQDYFPLESAVDVVLLACVTDFFLGFNAGTWLRIRLHDVARSAEKWVQSFQEGPTDDADCNRNDKLRAAHAALLSGTGLISGDPDDVQPPPTDASELWNYWGAGGNTGVSGQVLRYADNPSAASKACTFTFEHGDISISVDHREVASVEDCDKDRDVTGDIVWPTTTIFCRYLCERSSELLAGKKLNVLDLAAGIGIVGLLAATLNPDASVCLVDIPWACKRLRSNVAVATARSRRLASRASSLAVHELWWGDEAGIASLVGARGLFDVILCCEVVYQQPLHVLEALKSTLQALLAPSGKLLFAYQPRDGAEVTDALFFQSLTEHFERTSLESLAPWDDVWDSPCREVFCYVHRRDATV